MFRYHLFRNGLRVIQLAISRLIVTGRENIPASGPYLVAVNHMSSADSPLLMIAFDPLPWRFFAGEAWRDHWFFGPAMHWLGGIYINRGQLDRAAVREAIEALQGGAVFGLAPEGTRSKVGAMMPARDGAAYLASRTGVPIVPVGMNNTDVLFDNTRRRQRTDVEIRIGRPFSLPELDHRARKPELAAYTHLIMAHIAVMVDPRHRGAYADSPAVAALLAGEDPWPHCLAAEGLTAESGVVNPSPLPAPAG
jgi:1-acyl-sn-glycerol-3-phosphate acyltransferase